MVLASIQVDTEKTLAVEDFPVPTNLKAVQQFLKMSGWYHRFVPHFSQLTEPLYTLKRKEAKVKLTPECQAAIDHLKKCLFSGILLFIISCGVLLGF